ncbi:MAG: hypothetical protein A2268_07100 [Candidatus Raymondbacteria bacterium RifOxyA12_full_50_37]|uniref:Secretion system C-terminal sorting domain-containing protein n=1 Tax=Candidatus Raymondbacteria bacterium RIFOXYD12_FULL_49_13 TaxID=1817890 RepID=A0A1F7FEY8_UNCRA|nr:MAG: hypothetical protein A2350_20820 [Candidatus Raymondbacteria bacterium RifOxyB12_full_50_8]OGJ89742.1 MAG: hypothetical protein A2268_07100 [Candidatus Raymondbacteria bacterium RifOxyA12_full_50_37]OGJ91151.1 MAG: hypothetical protein A2248_01250 [Candidatus Raymondbacteria bacterium RIFOXYA2_FULL_49_16]OGJ97549.1 MAG: hypothetical protein A2453_02015 [Candidatus Raymondbacteria bacterium RIFOXYC2_FULL_50_21]OGK05022.1 MAG: hypothetical protein A2519_10125 [Candidatus Raymondbacteria b
MKQLAVLGFLAVSIFSAQPTTHVFWHKALENSYDLEAVGVPAASIVHEGPMASAMFAVGLGYAGAGIVIGSAATDDQAWCAVMWAGSLNHDSLSLQVDSAFLRGEYSDGWINDGFCNAGPIYLKKAVVDVSFGIMMYGGPENIPEDAAWADLDPMNSLGFNMPIIEGTDTYDTISGVAGRSAWDQASVLDSQFARIDITEQVNYILANSGQFAIVLLTEMGQGSLGKINLYANEACTLTYTSENGSVNGSDNPWTQDGNTSHILTYGNQISVEKRAPAQAHDAGLSAAPNPFNAVTKIALQLSSGQAGSKNAKIEIFNMYGSLVQTLSAAGNQLQTGIIWDAGENPSGIYLVRVTMGNTVLSRQITLLR